MKCKKIDLGESVANVLTMFGLIGILVGEITWITAILLLFGSMSNIGIQVAKIIKTRRAMNAEKKESW